MVMNTRLRISPPGAASAAVHHQQASEFQDHGELERDLIPGLPDDVASLCLCRVPPSILFSVCSAWRRLLYSPLFPPFLSLYALLSPTATGESVASIEFMSYDPMSGDWLPVPPPPPPVRLRLRHPSFISRVLSVQSLAVAGKLVLIAATGGSGDSDGLLPALPLPLVLSPVTAAWSHGPALPAPRRWCAAGTLSGSVFVAGGIGSHFTDDVARSFHTWNAGAGAGERWESLGRLKYGRFSREAVGAVGCRGKLWMVNVAAKQGAVYDAGGSGTWEEMPEKMLDGWRGPAAAMAEEDIYVMDADRGVLRRWDWEEGEWMEVAESPALRGAQHIAAAGGRVCAVVEGGRGVAVVDVKSAPGRFWVVETPPGHEAIAVHVLPRMCHRRGKRPAGFL